MATEMPEPFERVLQALELDSKTLNQPVDATFIPERSARRDGSLDSLPILALEGDDRPAELALHQVFGEGGRGEIRLANQLSLRRSVAVKSLKGETTPAATQELLREARITGNLEHPNVVPVYALGRDAQGRVLLVMKKVEGEPWGKLLRAEACPRTDAQMERHIEIFTQVCNAVEFAHSQGIVHRDLKPDNIMVGAFGEVVVLDWGLAVSLEGDAARDLPRAAELRGLAGTPAYMAPEQVEGDGAKLGRWTDVYLLGAILHELCCGGPPHRGEVLAEVLERAYRSAPYPYDARMPGELAEICHKAMHADPAQRFASVADLRKAVHAFGRHRQSSQLAAEARARLDALGGIEPSPDADRAAHAHAALAQSRFGFEQALRTWPESPLARAGLQAARERTVELELSLGNLAGAERAMAELTAPRPVLAEKVEALRTRLAAQHAELEKLRALQRDIDPDSSERVRNVMLMVCGLVWCVVPVGFGYWERHGHGAMTTAELTWAWVIFSVSAAGGVWLGRRELLGNRMGRRIAVAIGVMVVAAGAVRLDTALLGSTVHAGIGYELISYATIAGMVAVFVDVRFSAAALVYTLAGLLAAFKPELAFFIAGCSNFVALFPTALFWTRLQRFECESLPMGRWGRDAQDQPATRRAQSA